MKRSYSSTAGNVKEGIEYTENIFNKKHNSIMHSGRHAVDVYHVAGSPEAVGLPEYPRLLNC